MGLTILGVLITVINGLALLMFIVYMLSHLRMILAFKGEYKETDAIFMGVKGFGLGTVEDPKTYEPILEYYNEYSGKTIRKVFLNSGMNQNNVSETVKIQYTEKTERVVDERYTPKNKYKLMHYLTPIIVTGIVQVIGFIMIVVGIMLEH